MDPLKFIRPTLGAFRGAPTPEAANLEPTHELDAGILSEKGHHLILRFEGFVEGLTLAEMGTFLAIHVLTPITEHYAGPVPLPTVEIIDLGKLSPDNTDKRWVCAYLRLDPSNPDFQTISRVDLLHLWLDPLNRLMFQDHPGVTLAASWNPTKIGMDRLNQVRLGGVTDRDSYPKPSIIKHYVDQANTFLRQFNVQIIDYKGNRGGIRFELSSYEKFDKVKSIEWVQHDNCDSSEPLIIRAYRQLFIQYPYQVSILGTGDSSTTVANDVMLWAKSLLPNPEDVIGADCDGDFLHLYLLKAEAVSIIRAAGDSLRHTLHDPLLNNPVSTYLGNMNYKAFVNSPQAGINDAAKKMDGRFDDLSARQERAELEMKLVRQELANNTQTLEVIRTQVQSLQDFAGHILQLTMQMQREMTQTRQAVALQGDSNALTAMALQIGDDIVDLRRQRDLAENQLGMEQIESRIVELQKQREGLMTDARKAMQASSTIVATPSKFDLSPFTASAKSIPCPPSALFQTPTSVPSGAKRSAQGLFRDPPESPLAKKSKTTDDNPFVARLSQPPQDQPMSEGDTSDKFPLETS